MKRDFHNPKQIVLRFNNPNRTKDKTYADIFPWLINQQNRHASVHLLIGLAQHYFGNKDFVKVTSENLRRGVMPFGNQKIQSQTRNKNYKPQHKQIPDAESEPTSQLSKKPSSATSTKDSNGSDMSKEDLHNAFNFNSKQ